ncbi:MAG: hypothetical protein IKO22_06995 [Oscillospiraceae bacterium]|nr:hypothetical protein [Oscillospiraceae bacterium]
MRIIDSNRDYYDFLQNIWRDDTITFDRRDSYVLSKEEFSSAFFDESYKWSKYYLKYHSEGDKHKYVLLQVCNNFWLFDLFITRTGAEGICLNYELHLNEAWQDYTRYPELIRLSAIRIPRYLFWYSRPDVSLNVADMIKRGEYEADKVFNEFAYSKSMGESYAKDVRHIPILKNIGIAAEIPPEDIFLALEEYFLTQRRNSERTESTGLTDIDKVTNHGFDAKTSFRGK